MIRSGAGTLLSDSTERDLLDNDCREFSLSILTELVAETIVKVVGVVVELIVVVSQFWGPKRPQIVL